MSENKFKDKEPANGLLFVFLHRNG